MDSENMHPNEASSGVDRTTAIPAPPKEMPNQGHTQPNESMDSIKATRSYGDDTYVPELDGRPVPPGQKPRGKQNHSHTGAQTQGGRGQGGHRQGGHGQGGREQGGRGQGDRRQGGHGQGGRGQGGHGQGGRGQGGRGR